MLTTACLGIPTTWGCFCRMRGHDIPRRIQLDNWSLALGTTRSGSVGENSPITKSPSMTTLRLSAVDNHVYVAMCSPARDMTAGYHSVRLFCSYVPKRNSHPNISLVGTLECCRSNVSQTVPIYSALFTDVVDRGTVFATTEEKEDIVYADIGMFLAQFVRLLGYQRFF